MRKLLAFMKEGGFVAVLMDQNVDYYEGVYVDFFGRCACTNKGLALLARHTGAPVLPAVMIREPDGFRVEIGPEIPFAETGDKRKDLEAATLRYNQVIEGFIRRHPDQWLWVHQRWKTRPYAPWTGTCTLGR
jgi:KDO2-lipid IV(A) lauroyltransferase